jgi:hypothetical protein
MRCDGTAAGIPYVEWLAGPDGMSFELQVGSEHTQEDIRRAKAELRRDRDVVTITVRRHAVTCICELCDTEGEYT